MFDQPTTFGISSSRRRKPRKPRNPTPEELHRLAEEAIAKQDPQKMTVGTTGPRAACPAGKHDTDNDGICYTCGRYVASSDAGRYI